jgi:hypothetical protein
MNRKMMVLSILLFISHWTICRCHGYVQIFIDSPGNDTFVLASDFRKVEVSTIGVIPGHEYELNMALYSEDARAYSLQMHPNFEWSAAVRFFSASFLQPEEAQVRPYLLRSSHLLATQIGPH